MKKIFYLKTCDTCKRILKEFDLQGFELREIKSNPIDEKELNELRTLTDSYDSLLNKRAQIYKREKLKDKNLKEEEIKELILSEYTLLKRPVFQFPGRVFVGNSKSTIESLKEFVKP
jgi:arsenate reductase